MPTSMPLVSRGFVVLVVAARVLTAAIAALFPITDSPDRVIEIVVVAGANDDRFVCALHLSEEGAAGRNLVWSLADQPRPVHR